MELQISKHAQNRMQQRGLRYADIQLLAEYADMDVVIAGGLHAMRLSKRAYAIAQAQGVSTSVLDRLKRAVAVESVEGTLVTCLHLYGRRSAAYRGRANRKFFR
ncbi:hypothetical protein [Sphingobium sp. MK2]|uniref:hypothetical protein n=1 Tax=Sphingobium sp. MK2 TaxID=3116540 RepID=UPI0032E35F28